MGNINITDLIYDSFVYDNSYIVVLNTVDELDSDLNKRLLLGRVQHSENDSEVVPLYEEEYDDVLEYYLQLKSAFLKSEEEVVDNGRDEQ